METKAVYFENTGKENTGATLRLAADRAKQLGIEKVLVASSTGDTAVQALEVMGGVNLIVVSTATGLSQPDVQRFTEANRKKLEGKGITILTTGHTLAGVSRALRLQFETMAIGEILAHTLRIFGQGTKVACEMAMMAADAGLVRTDEDVIAVAGTGGGADTAVVLRPVNSHRFFDLKVREIICKPRL